MTEPPREPRPGARALQPALVMLAVVLAVLIVAEGALLSGTPDAPFMALLLFPATATVYAVAGLVAWYRRPGNPMGPLMIMGALSWLLAGGLNTTSLPLIAVGTATATLPVAVAVHLLHAFPSGRVRGRLPWACVTVAYLICTVLQVPLYVFGVYDPAVRPLAVVSRPDLVQIAHRSQAVVAAAMVLATSFVLLQRFRRADHRSRRVFGPLMLYGVFTLCVVTFAAQLDRSFGWDPLWRAVVQIVLLAGIPVAFAVAVIRGGFRRTGDLQELSDWLGQARGSRAGLVAALSSTLGDTSVELAFWAPDRHRYLDAEGHELVLPFPGGPRASVEIDLAGRRVGAVLYDATLIDDARLVRQAGQMVAIAVDHERLTAEVRANEDELRRSRSRIVAAAMTERRRIARDLHDGLQVRLVVLALEAYALGEEASASPAVVRKAAELRAGIDAAAAELRGLVQGLMPALLIERGLFAATEDLVDRIPIPTTLAVVGDDQDLPDAVQSIAYFAVSEGLSNAVKHSGAQQVRVELNRFGDRLRIEIRDDGVGGARPGPGAGLRSLADRVDVVSGTFQVDSPPRQGATVAVSLPCGS